MEDRNKRILYLDLDGTVRKGFDEIGKFVNSFKDVEVFPEVPELIKKFKDAGWIIVAITNQGGIALGLLTYNDCMAALMETNRQCFSQFDKVLVCIHHPEAKELKDAICYCRKPRIGLVVEAAIELGIDRDEYYPPHMALFVGDRPEDEECAKNANIKFMPAKELRALTSVEGL